jgi:phosphoribosylformylglycinamidine synthase
LPALDLEAHARLLSLVAGLVVDRLPAGIHDVSDGGLALALAEIAVASGVGFEVEGIASHAELFSESPSRVVVNATPEAAEAILTRAKSAGVPASVIGTSGGDRMAVKGLFDHNIGDAVDSWRTSFPLSS